MFKRNLYKFTVVLNLSLMALLAGCDSARHSYYKLKLRLTSVNISETSTFQQNTEKHDIEIITLLNDLYLPWGMTFLPNGSLLITEKPGTLYRYNPASGFRETITGMPDTKAWGQGGLMDIILHPEFEKNRWLYFSYAGLMPDKLAATRVARAQLIGNQLQNLEVLFTAMPAKKTGAHFGSALVFDKQNYLYITSGERHSRPLVQDLSNHIGKIIRLHDDGRVPKDNPFVNNAKALPEIFTYGHRNPQGITLEPHTGKIWSVEHGPRGGDEINIIDAGKNYGWPVITYGEEYTGGKIGEGTHKEGMEQPIYYYVPSIAPSNLFFYQGQAFPHWKGNLFIGALSLTHINRLEIENGQVIHEERLIDDIGFRIKSIEEGPDGFIYALTDSGKLLQIKPKD